MLGENVQKLLGKGAAPARFADGSLAVSEAGLGGEVLRRFPGGAWPLRGVKLLLAAAFARAGWRLGAAPWRGGTRSQRDGLKILQRE